MSVSLASSPQSTFAADSAALRHALSPTREAALLNEVGRMVRGTLSLPQLLEKLAEIVCGSIDAHEFWIALLDDITDELSFAYARRPPNVPFVDRHWRRDEGLTGVVLRSGDPLNTPDYMATCHTYGVEPILPPDAPPVTAWLGVPLVHQERPLGVLVVSTRSSGVRYDANDEHFMLMVADQAAAAVANAQLYAQAQQQAQQLQLINRIGRTISSTLDPRELPLLLARELHAVLPVEDIVVLVETATGELEVRAALTAPAMRGPRHDAGAGLAGQALRSGQIIHADVGPGGTNLVPFDGADVRCVLCVPLMGQRLRGVIELHNKRGSHFNRADEQLLQAVAAQAVIALANAERYGATDQALHMQLRTAEQRNEQLLDIVALGNALQDCEDATSLAQEVAATVQRLARTERVVIALADAEHQYLVPHALRGWNQPPTPFMNHSLPLSSVELALSQAHALGVATYHIGAHPLLPEIRDAVITRIADRQGMLSGVIVIDQAAPVTPGVVRVLEIVANQAAIAANNVGLRAEQQQIVDRLTALNALSLAVNTAQLDVPQMAQMTISGAVGTTGGIGGGVLVLNNGVVQAQYSFALPQVLGDAVLPLLPTVDGDYLEIDADTLPPAARDTLAQRLLLVPLRGATLTLGAMWLGFAAPVITQTEREMAVLYGKMAGAVIENLNLVAALRAAHDRMATILASTHEGMLMVTADQHVSVANSAFGDLLSIDEAHLLGKTVEQLCADNGPLGLAIADSTAVCTALTATLGGNAAPVQSEFTLHDGLQYLEWTVLPAHGEGDHGVGALLVVHDVTADRQIEKLRQDLSHMIVHDLRAPLTNLMVGIDMLLKQQHGPLTGDQVRILQIAASSSQQMLDLVNDLLDIRRLETHTLPLEPQPAALQAIAGSVLERLERVAHDRRVTLHDAVAPLPLVEVDPDMVRRILQNLVDNALKFSPRNGEVWIESHVAGADELPAEHASGTWMVVSVRDQGPGIPEAYHAMIFQLFTQAPGEQKRGSGLGLAFCKLAVEAHGGMIWLASTPGRGSTFRFTLPVMERDRGRTNRQDAKDAKK